MPCHAKEVYNIPTCASNPSQLYDPSHQRPFTMHITLTAFLVGRLAVANLVQRQDTSGIPRPPLGDVPYGTNVASCTVPGKLAITLDDGPDIYTSDLLDILKKNNAKATFFIVGDNGRFQRKNTGDPTGPYPALLKRMHAEGHQIGSHSWSHANFSALSSQGRREELLKLESVFASVLGFIPTYFRPPYTSWDDATNGDLRALGYHNVNFDLDTEDYKNNYEKSRGFITSGFSTGEKNSVKSSFITLLHDIQEKSVYEFLPWVIDEATKHGYELVTVGECLGDPSNYWYRDAVTGQAWSGEPPVKPKQDATSGSSSSTKSAESSNSLSVESQTAVFTAGTATAQAAATSPAAKPNGASRSGNLFSGMGVFLTCSAAAIFPFL
jgi:peptidoglycan/xylan/chitin deacetylase (PgdA/CDA1 family)